MLARTLGEGAFAETAVAMADATAAPGAPLHTALLAAAGAGDALLAAARPGAPPQQHQYGEGARSEHMAQRPGVCCACRFCTAVIDGSTLL